MTTRPAIWTARDEYASGQRPLRVRESRCVFGCLVRRLREIQSGRGDLIDPKPRLDDRAVLSCGDVEGVRREIVKGL